MPGRKTPDMPRTPEQGPVYSPDQDRRWLLLELLALSCFYAACAGLEAFVLSIDASVSMALSSAAAAVTATILWCAVMTAWVLWRLGASGRMGWVPVLALGAVAGAVFFQLWALVLVCAFDDGPVLESIDAFVRYEARPKGQTGAIMGLVLGLSWLIPIRKLGRLSWWKKL